MVSNESRLQRHARKFRESSIPHKVLRRYLEKSHGWNEDQLRRHICHVCAWVALANSLEDSTKLFRDNSWSLDNPSRPSLDYDSLSPVTVLTKLLRRLNILAPLDHRTRHALLAVGSCCRVAIGMDSCKRCQDWIDLSKSLPCLKKVRLGTREDTSTAIVSSVTKEKSDCVESRQDSFMFKRIRRLNRSLCKWSNTAALDRDVLALGIIGRLHRTLSAEIVDTIQLRTFLYDIIGALCPPRAKSHASEGPQPLDKISGESMRIAADTQKKIRRFVCKAIQMWRSELQLEDTQIEPILVHLRKTMESFEAHHGGLENACAEKEWRALYIAVGISGSLLGTGGQLSKKCLQESACVDSGQGSGDASSLVAQDRFGTRLGRPNSRKGEYVPDVHLQKLSTVEMREVREIACQCRLMQASFYFVHPRTQKMRLLVPKDKCTQCHRRYRAVDGMLTIFCETRRLKYCVHAKALVDCSVCGGIVCPHGIVKRNCKFCRKCRR